MRRHQGRLEQRRDSLLRQDLAPPSHTTWFPLSKCVTFQQNASCGILWTASCTVKVFFIVCSGHATYTQAGLILHCLFYSD